jgi:hypothetical protein
MLENGSKHQPREFTPEYVDSADTHLTDITEFLQGRYIQHEGLSFMPVTLMERRM